MICKKCGYQNSNDAKYCNACGTKLQDTSKMSIDKKYKFILGVIAIMMVFTAVMAIVSAGKPGGNEGAKPAVSTSNTSVTEKNEFPKNYKENPVDFFYDYALVKKDFYDDKYIYTYILDPDAMIEPLHNGNYNSELVFIGFEFSDEFGFYNEYFVEHLESIEEIDGEDGAYSIVTSVDSGEQKTYVVNGYSDTMTDEYGNIREGYMYKCGIYELYRIELAEDCTFCNRAEVVSLERLKREQDQPYTDDCVLCGHAEPVSVDQIVKKTERTQPEIEDYVRVRIATYGGKAVALEIPYGCKLRGHLLDEGFCQVCGSYFAEDASEEVMNYADAQKNPEPVYINEIVALGGRNGLVWTRSTEPVNYGFEFTNEDAPDCWSYTDYDVGGHTPGEVYDNWGNKYKYGIHVDGRESDYYYFSVDLNGEYTTFTGTVACPENAKAISSFAYNQSTAYTKYFYVYGDDTHLYTSPTIRYDYSPQTFNVNVTGVERMTIIYPATPGPNEIATIYDGMVS